MYSYLLKTQKEKLISIIKGWVESFNKYAEISRKEALEALKPGETNRTQERVIYSDQWKKAFSEETEKSKIKVNSVFEELFKEIEKDITDAPKEEAINSIMAFNLRNIKNIPQKEKQIELQMLLNKYGENYLINKAIHDIANQEKIYLDDTRKIIDFNRAERLKDTIDKLFNDWNRIHGTISPNGYISIVLSTIEDFDFGSDTKNNLSLFDFFNTNVIAENEEKNEDTKTESVYSWN